MTQHAVLSDDDPRIVGGRRVCNKCNIDKPLTAFTKAKMYEMGRSLCCKECYNLRACEIRRERGIGPPVHAPPIEPTQRDYKRFKYRGISSAAFKALYDAQNGLCGICEKPMDFLGKHTCLDHNHKTGIVRGVLCLRCNLGIGHMRDDVSLMRAAVAYLEKHEG